MARAIYQDCDVYLLDDPLSVVDVHVGRHIMQHVIGHKGILRDKTRILVTHGLSYVQNADSIVVMEDGKIVEMGRHSELEERKGPFCAFLEQLKTNDGRETSVKANLLDSEEDISLEKDKEDTAKAVGPELLKKEKEKVGWVGWKVYQSFFQSASYSRCLGFLLTSTAFFGLQTCRGFHLTSWTAQSTFSSNQTDSRMLAIYAATGASEALAFVLSMLCLTSATVAVSLNLHRPLLRTVLRSPMLFFDSTPIGDVLNRFVTDMYMIDFALPFTFRLLITSILQATMAVSAIIISTPMFLFVVVPLAVVYWNLLSISVPTTRQLRRLEGFFRSPIVSKLSEMASGVSSIRAFQKMEYFRSSFGLAVDQLIRCRYMSALGERWLATRLVILGNLVVFFAVLFASFSQSFGWTESPGTVAFIIFSSINITDSLLVAVRQICFTEANISAVERIREFSSLPTEEQEVKDALETSIPTSWPESGNISFIHYSARYRPYLDLVLNDIHVDIRSGEKVGIVGRTGAGKSSFVLALFRMIEAAEGEIKIDGVDIKSLDLRCLRENLTIIPQDPILFPGSLRFNLDPSGVFSEAELQEAIELAHLTDLVSSSQKGLQMNISSRGDGLSGGQRQLICLARAILHKSKILVLDEATAAVDVATESWIQKTIKDQFSSSTVITVAHRINTIMDYDRILLLDNGNIAESGAPRDLLRQRNSLLSKLAANEQHL